MQWWTLSREAYDLLHLVAIKVSKLMGMCGLYRLSLLLWRDNSESICLWPSLSITHSRIKVNQNPNFFSETSCNAHSLASMNPHGCWHSPLLLLFRSFRQFCSSLHSGMESLTPPISVALERKQGTCAFPVWCGGCEGLGNAGPFFPWLPLVSLFSLQLFSVLSWACDYPPSRSLTLHPMLFTQPPISFGLIAKISL